MVICVVTRMVFVDVFNGMYTKNNLGAVLVMGVMEVNKRVDLGKIKELQDQENRRQAIFPAVEIHGIIACNGNEGNPQ